MQAESPSVIKPVVCCDGSGHFVGISSLLVTISTALSPASSPPWKYASPHYILLHEVGPCAKAENAETHKLLKEGLDPDNKDEADCQREASAAVS